MPETEYPTWAIAAVAVFGRHTTPLFIRTFTSPREVLEHPDAATCANLYAGEEDVVRLHFLLFSSLDRCDDILRERRKQQQLEKGSSIASRQGPGSLRTVVGVSAGADVRFLGRLLRNHKFTSYGFQSASGIRTILAIVGDIPLDAVLPLCRSTYEAASAALCNPFRTPRMHAHLLQSWSKSGSQEPTILPAEYTENLRAAPTPERVAEEPSLAYSHGFREQIRTIIEPFTVTARSALV
ncbi:hypothetical protein C3747_95g101 [Trypanosoma cruzi]|uniref:Uncharacterized protein n=2 Tax=Trypanosoma cruzi TaxID=5693 RepID=Q4DSX3_TRYCC|nr:hypothetical protein, conserved [Trypanosoma cruzi]EAN95630.1 hypothetical protein, conserved [Trypanosoma cruzi]KAF5219655.1 hypothetical protein ECC02_007393 [Trypanosoma cruzi]KAF8296745.1 hypothetical protein TcYC6_0085900 [Trypanosoma cruzi]PWV08044.1 hypothetical protein C3747_95g101 [Trypanosoma cruzi]|eukprot:XP_817481.1 hypothetical protein [Trypanosoma cruzi strain CL Brener]